MTEPTDPNSSDFALIQLLPNMLTVAAICAGLTSIQFGIHGNFERAVQLILAACILDGLDGRLARLLGSDSKMGAELDSLADFLNFGVAPPLLVYFWALQDVRDAAWLSVLIYAVCCVVRLARFNVADKADQSEAPSAYFVGVPAPAGALLVMLPMYVSFALASRPVLPAVVICFYMIAIGFLMISRIPTWSFKTTKVPRSKVKFFLVGFAFVGAAVLSFAWITLVGLCIVYSSTVVWALLTKEPAQIHKG